MSQWQRSFMKTKLKLVLILLVALILCTSCADFELGQKKQVDFQQQSYRLLKTKDYHYKLVIVFLLSILFSYKVGRKF